MAKRRNFSAPFKAKVTLEALRNEHTVSELARRAKERSAGEAGKGPIITNSTIRKFRRASMSAGKQTRMVKAAEAPS